MSTKRPGHFSGEVKKIFSGDIYLVLILFMAVALRFYGIQNKGLWADDAYGVSFISYPWHDLWGHRYLNRPLYFVFLKLWSGLFGVGEFSLRFPSVVFGALSVPALYRLGNMLFDRKTALIAAFLLAVSPFHIYWSQEVRNLSLAVLLFLVNMCFFFSLIKFKEKKHYLGHAVSGIALFYAHPMGLYLMPLQYLFCLLAFDKTRLLNDLKHWIILLVAMLPVIFLCLDDHGKNMFVYLHRSLFQIFEAFNFGGPCQAHGQSGFLIPAGQLVIPRVLDVLFLCFFFLGFKILLERGRSPDNKDVRNKTIFLSLWLAIPLLFPFFLLRHTVIALPAYYLIVALGFASIRNRGIFMMVFIIISVPLGFALRNYYHLGSARVSWREAGPYVHRNIQKNDVVVFVPTDQMPPFFYYFSDKPDGKVIKYIDRKGYWTGSGFKRQFWVADNLYVGVDLFAEKVFINANPLALFAQQKRSVWLVISPYWFGVDPGVIQTYFEQYYSQDSRMILDYNGVEVRHYQPKAGVN